MRTFELMTSGLMITKVKANNAEEALSKFSTMTNEQKVKNTSIVDVSYYGDIEEIF